MTHHPLVQVMLAWQNFTGQADGSAAESALGDVQVSPLAAETHSARMDLRVLVGRAFRATAGEPAGICGSVEFRTDVFDAASIEVLIERLARVLVALTDDPARALSSVDVLDAAEHARLDEVGQPGGADPACCCGVVDSGGVRRAGGPRAGCGGGGVW